MNLLPILPLLLVCGCMTTRSVVDRPVVFNEPIASNQIMQVVDTNHDGVVQPHEMQTALDQPSGLFVFICLAGVLIGIVIVTMTYSKLITPKAEPVDDQLPPEEQR
jgi:hypothetical protein